MPARLVPRVLMNRLFSPPVEPVQGDEPLTAPYALRKIEAILLAHGISDVAVVPPERLSHAIGPRTRVVGVTAHDPFGYSPVSTKLTMLFGGGPSWNETFFEELGERIQSLRHRAPFRVIAGGPGIWQMSYRRPEWIDTVYQGEAEIDFPRIAKTALAGGYVPPTVHGTPPTLEEIPTIVKAARIGEVQITRGCPRGCEFCSITPDRYRTIPWESIEREIRVNRAAGEFNVELVTDDILLYGAKKLRTNHDAAVGLIAKIKATGADQIGFAHVSAPAVREASETMLEMGRIAEWDKRRGLTPVVGLETGSVRIFRKYMPAKSFPYKPEEWRDTILEATRIMNESGIDPCYTMTIGFPDETDADVDESISMVDAMVAQGFRAYVFPLPVIPISTSRIHGNAMPQLETLPSRYWDLLQICWEHDLRLSRAMLPSLVGRMKSPVARRMTTYFVERIAPHVTRVFEEFRQTHGRSAYGYRGIDLRGTVGVLRSAMWILQASARPPAGRTAPPLVPMAN